MREYAPERARRFQHDVIQRLEAMPGVESVIMVGTGIVLAGASAGVALPDGAADQRLRVGYNEVGQRYFETLRTPLVGGREFDDRDSIQAPRVAASTKRSHGGCGPTGR